MTKRTIAVLLPVALLLACGRPATDDAPAAEADTGAEPSAADIAHAQLALLRKPSPEGARVWFVSPADGAELASPVVVEFGLEGMELRHAGDAGENSGHHHILLNTGLPRMDLPIITDDNHIHFGQGQTSVELSLEPGEHTLQLLLGDDLHIPHNPPVMSDAITITVR